MTKAEQLRLVTFRSKYLEHAKRIDNIAATCRYFGISRQKFYKWRKRFEQLGAAGLCDRPRTPHHTPNATPRAVVSKLLYLRQNYHFGAPRIRDYLKRFHDIRIAASTVQSILAKHGLRRLPANQKHQPHGKRWKRYEKPQPGHRLQMDVKFLERIPGTRKRLYQFTAIDDCTRIRVLKIYDSCNQVTAVDFADEVIRRLPFRIHVVQTDNGAEFQSKFHWHLEELDIRHVHIRPRTPRLNGKVERSHRVDNEEFYQLLDKDGVSDDIHLFNKKLREWENYYNHHRPHGGLGGQTPFERFLERTKVSRRSPLHTPNATPAISTCQKNIGAIAFGECYEYSVAKQLSLALERKRRGRRAGRKQTKPIKSEPHRTRHPLSHRHPVHVTVRTHSAVGTMRRHRAYRALHRALRCTAARADFRVVHLSIQRTHVHFLVEANDALALARGMQGLQISAAKALNRSLSRRGNVFIDRYHAVHVTNPTQACHALRYVLANWRHHGHAHDARRIDPYSSAYVMLEVSPPLGPLPLCRAETWLLAHLTLDRYLSTIHNRIRPRKTA